MNRPPVFAPAAFLAASTAWTLTLAFGEPTIGTIAGAVVATDLILVTIVAVVGIVVAGARWARRFAVVVIVLMGAMALTMPISNNWIIALLLTGLAVAALAGPSLDGRLSGPSPGGPPPRAVALPLTLLLMPAIVAFASGSPLTAASWTLVAGAPIAAWAYGKAWSAGLWSARVVVPAVGLVAIVSFDAWSILLLGATLVVESWLAWSSDAGAAVRISDAGPAPRSVSMPPELTPPEILSAAGLDERGRPMHDRSSSKGVEEGDG